MPESLAPSQSQIMSSLQNIKSASAGDFIGNLARNLSSPLSLGLGAGAAGIGALMTEPREDESGEKRRPRLRMLGNAALAGLDGLLLGAALNSAGKSGAAVDIPVATVPVEKSAMKVLHAF